MDPRLGSFDVCFFCLATRVVFFEKVYTLVERNDYSYYSWLLKTETPLKKYTEVKKWIISPKVSG